MTSGCWSNQPPAGAMLPVEVRGLRIEGEQSSFDFDVTMGWGHPLGFGGTAYVDDNYPIQRRFDLGIGWSLAPGVCRDGLGLIDLGPGSTPGDFSWEMPEAPWGPRPTQAVTFTSSRTWSDGHTVTGTFTYRFDLL